MNIEVRQPDIGAQGTRRHRRLRHPSQELARGPAALSQQSLVGLSADLRAASAPRLRQGLSLSQEPAAGVAPRRVAARRRIAGKRSRLHAASSISISTGSNGAIMNPLSPTGQGDQNDELSAAMAFAANESQLDGWNRRDPRLQGVGRRALRGRRMSSRGNPQARRRSSASRMCCSLSRTSELLGKRRYWPIYRGGGRGRAARSASTSSAPAGAR